MLAQLLVVVEQKCVLTLVSSMVCWVAVQVTAPIVGVFLCSCVYFNCRLLCLEYNCDCMRHD